MKIANLFIIILFLFNALLADEKKIKIAITTDMIPYSFVNEDGPNGILVDYWKLWAQKTNQKIEFVPLPWKETLEAIKNKELDIHSGLFEDNRRKEYINYIKPIYIFPNLSTPHNTQANSFDIPLVFISLPRFLDSLGIVKLELLL